MPAKGAPPSNLMAAIRSVQLEAVKSALDEGADIEEPDIHGSTGLPLRTACFGGDLETVRELLRRGADLNATGGDGPGAPLRLALRCGHRHIAALLLEHGAKVPPGLQLPPELLQQPDNLGQSIKPLFEGFESDTLAAPGNDESDVTASDLQTSAARDSQPDTLLEATQLPTDHEALATLSRPVFPDGHEIEEVDVSACYGTDTNLLGLDLLRLAEEADRANAPPPPPSPKGFWTTSRKKQ